MNLLLVDDEIAMLHIMEKAIDWKKKGIQKVFTAYNTDLARDIISSSKIDLVICDIEMPKENGLSLIQWIQDMYPEIINIILTGYPDFNYARSAISLGVYRYLLKPIAFDELEETIASSSSNAIGFSKYRLHLMNWKKQLLQQWKSWRSIKQKTNRKQIRR